MHSCPDCGQACYCGGDIEDHDTGDEYYLACIHCGEEDREDYPMILEDELRSSQTPEGQATEPEARVR